MNFIEINERKIGAGYPPLVIAEIGINHEGDFGKALKMVEDAYMAGCECVKFQCHVIEDEMVPAARHIVPENASESIWEIMARCSLSYDQDRQLKAIVEDYGMIYLSTPFSRSAAIRLESMGVAAYKIGSGECNNYPLIKHIAQYGKPVILSTGMNGLNSIRKAVNILRDYNIPYALMHCASIYPTPDEKVRLGALDILHREFPDAVLGLSDHSITIYPCLGAVSLGVSILERHFTSDKSWPGPDIPISMDPQELKKLIDGSRIIYASMGGTKDVLPEEKPTMDFAYASVVTLRNISKGEVFTEENIWVKRPGTGTIKAEDYEKLLGLKAARDISQDILLSWNDVDSEDVYSEQRRLLDESRAFNAQIRERIDNGYTPDIRYGKRNEWFRNNFWRDLVYIRKVLNKIIRRLSDEFNKHLGEHASIIDIGCGPGYHSLELSRYGFNVTGIDLSSESIDIAREYAHNNPEPPKPNSLQYIAGDILSLELERQFDAACFFFSLHHFPTPSRILERVSKIVRPGGLLFAVEPARENFGEQEAIIAFLVRLLLSQCGNYFKEVKLPETKVEFNKVIEKTVREFRNARSDEEEMQSPSDNSSSGDEMISALEIFADVIWSEYDYCFSDRVAAGARGNNSSEEVSLGLKIIDLDRRLVEADIIKPSRFVWLGKLKKSEKI